MIGPSSGTRAISPVMPSTAAKGAGAPTGSAGAKGQQGAPGGAVTPDVPRLCDVGACLAENNEGGASGMGGHEGASGTGEPQRMGDLPEEALDAGMAAIPGAKGVSLVRRLLRALRLERLLEQVAQSNAEGKAARGVEGLAERAAVAGARYPKQVAQALRMTPDKLQKSITSFTENIAKHQGYLKNPQAHVPNWSQLTQQHQQNLIHHWHSDIGRAEAYRDIAEGVLKGLFR